MQKEVEVISHKGLGFVIQNPEICPCDTVP